MKSVLITGGTGAFGQAFTRYLLKHVEPSRIVIYSRNEFNQHLMAAALREHEKRLRFMIGDVRDRDRLKRALHDIDTVIHAAALKRIEVGHYNPIEMVKTNIDGAVNLIEATQDAGVKKVILLSSDKAFQPVSPYGLSKAMAECLFIAANNIRGWDGPSYSVCRYGNVWNSTGSVVPIWKKIIAEQKMAPMVVPVTDPDCTRFFMTMDEAIDLVMKAYREMRGGEVFVPTLPAYRLGDLAEAMGARMSIKGLPAWEKKHESMAEGNSSDIAERLTVEDLRRALDAC